MDTDFFHAVPTREGAQAAAFSPPIAPFWHLQRGSGGRLLANRIRDLYGCRSAMCSACRKSVSVLTFFAIVPGNRFFAIVRTAGSRSEISMGYYGDVDWTSVAVGRVRVPWSSANFGFRNSESRVLLPSR